MLARAAEALRAEQVLQLEDVVRRPDFLPPPLQLPDVPVPAGHQGQADQVRGPGEGQHADRREGNDSGARDQADQGASGHGGGLLGPLALRPGEVLGADFVLRPPDLPPVGQACCSSTTRWDDLQGPGHAQQGHGQVPHGSGQVQQALEGAST